ncbi:glutamate mutase L [bacterium]|nr:glutamate mutase L [bacterium]
MKEHSPIDPDAIRIIIATDCGSTTTKCILIERKEEGFRQTFRGEAPTTVEAPFEDVTKGVLNSIQEVEELSGRKILDENGKIIYPSQGGTGVDIYISTSSAGGGLQMMVAGVVASMTGESAQRAALGAGAIVMDVLASNDGRLPHQRIDRIRRLRPDMILLSGGIDGGTVSHVVEMAELIAAADPKPRLGITYRLPVIFGGNVDAQDKVRDTLGEKTALTITDNIRPTLERENLMPARAKIQDLFEEHVMAQAPGYDKLMDWVDAPIMPTPAAMGLIMQTIARKKNMNVIGVDIGGATTDVFSDFKVEGQRIFNRSVSANLGMSYSVSNVMAEAGFANVMRWVPFDVKEQWLRNQIKNKMIRPTTIPQALSSLVIEHGLAREALRMAFSQHKSLAVGLKGVQQERGISDTFTQAASGESFIKMMDLDLLVGSGGVLSHAPRRSQAMLLLLDAFLPEAFTILAVDSIFMMPHLGVLSQVHEEAATQVFDRDCMIYLGSSVVPSGIARPCDRVCTYNFKWPDGSTDEGELKFGELKLFPKLAVGEDAEVEIHPTRAFDCGQGRGRTVKAHVHGGVVGVVLDGRGRPIHLSDDNVERRKQLLAWFEAMNIYPDLSQVTVMADE